MNRLHRQSLLLVLLLLIGCNTDETRIPNYEVSLRRNINSSKSDEFLQAGFLKAGDCIYCTTRKLSSDRLGFGGVIVVYTFDPSDPYCAFDLACPNEADASIKIGKPDDMLVCTCEKCGERYNLMFGLGTPMDGISKYPLKKYSAYVDPNDDQYIKVTP
jgi:hypothetical protein